MTAIEGREAHRPRPGIYSRLPVPMLVPVPVPVVAMLHLWIRDALS
jgi:hypothetical protein